ncbi:MAG: hydrolase [Dehalococcoidia bacterium]
MAEYKRIPLDEKGMPVRKEDAQPEPVEPCDCPTLDREDWDEVESGWSDITFLKTTTAAVMGVPVGFDSARKELEAKAEALGATVPEDAMFLNGSGRFRRPIMLEVEGAPAGKDIERPGGFAYSRLFEAPWGKLAKLADQTTQEATQKYGRKPDDVWVWYLTCRHCSKARNFETLIVAHYREGK